MHRLSKKSKKYGLLSFITDVISLPFVVAFWAIERVTDNC